ncbi:MAG TPA: aromatic ring-hydroxylating dioxygenase subunit alpha [Candidatus Acidoferrum sp.]|jgi:Rieske 2Fe-2S family protein|nr:aromatic ring-hydroxylating dioxygenase subunit alpha [Candidatus Acidoferrum sp.]
MKTFARPSVGAGAKTLPAKWYISPDVFAQEEERIFRSQWCCVGREELLPRAGDFFTVERGGESVIVTRDAGGTVHAFYNVCRHRGTRLCSEASGHFTGSIQCPYHAWTYALDGELKVARNMAEVPGFDRSEYPLKEAAVALWEGFIFINLRSSLILRQAQDKNGEDKNGEDDNGEDKFERVFAPLIGRFSRWNLASLQTARSITYELACNWKLVFLNYSECYHCPLVHPQLDKLSPSDSGHNDLSQGAFLGGYSELREHGTSLATSGRSSRQPLGSVGGDDLDRVYYYTIFPSLLLSLHPDYAMVHYCRPLAADRTEVTCAWLFDPSAIAKPDFDPADVVEFWDLTNRQDWHVNELTQQGLRSRAYSPGPYSNAEGLLSAFDRHYLTIMGA